MWAGWFHRSWRFGHVEALRQVGPKMPERGSKTSTVPVVWATFGIFSARSKWFPVTIGDHGQNLVISLWLKDKATINGVAAYRLTPPQKIPSAKTCWKSSCLDFWDQDGSLLIDYLPKSQTINAEYYSFLLVQLKDILKEKFRGKFTKGVLFLHDNAPAHRALAIQKKLAYLGFQSPDHPPYSQDLAPSDYHLFPGLKKQLKACHFSCDAEVMAAA